MKIKAARQFSENTVSPILSPARFFHGSRSLIRNTLCAVAAAFLASPVQAQTFPGKPITLVIPVVAGSSSNDIIGRAVAIRLGPIFGQQVIAENKPGAASTFGGSFVSKAAPDGYTLLLGIGGPIAISPMFIPLDYVPIRDLATVALIAKVPYMLAVNPAVPAKDLKELIALAQKTPLNFGSTGNGGTPHLCMEMLAHAAGVKMLHVPYKGGAQTMIDLISGQVNMYCAGLAAMLPQIKAGKLRALGSATNRRSELLPDLPTFIEQGYPDFEVASWIGVNAPGKTPRPIINRLYEGIARMMAAPDMKAYLLGQGAEPALLDPDEYNAYFKSEIAKWGKVIKDANIKAD